MEMSSNIDSVRSHFGAFSEAFIDVFEKFGPADKKPVYQFHCPMAEGNRGGDWLQRERELANPYFGKSMLRCGTIVRNWNSYPMEPGVSLGSSGLYPERAERAILCPLCECLPVPVFRESDYELMDCRVCGHRFCGFGAVAPESHVETHYGARYFEGGGAGYADYIREGNLVRNHGRRYGKMLARKLRSE